MAAEAINLRYVDEVWIIPCGDRTDKNVGAPAKDRLLMTNLLIDDFFPKDFPVKVNDIEIKNGKTIPTYDLMKQLIQDPENKECDFFFIVGSELLETMRSWDNGKELANEVKFIIFIRQGYVLTEVFLPKSYIIVHTTFVASSSTDIRNRIFALRNFGVLDIKQPGLQKRVSSDQNQSFAKMYEFDIEQAPLRTIPVDDDADDEDSISDERKELERLYLGVYGVVPISVIKHIRDNNLYVMEKSSK